MFVRVKNALGHQYDMDEELAKTRVEQGRVELLDDDRWPPTHRPRPAKPNLSHARRAARRQAQQPPADPTVVDDPQAPAPDGSASTTDTDPSLQQQETPA
jgi:hypothetical protein